LSFDFTPKQKEMKQAFFMSLLGVFGALAVWATPKQDHPLKEYAGKYKFPPGNYVPEAEISILDSTSLSVVSQAGTVTMIRSEGDVFYFLEYEGTAEFVRTDDKKVKGVKVKVAGLDMEGTREDQAIFIPLHPLRVLPFEKRK
jgi:hypothetical protein